MQKCIYKSKSAKSVNSLTDLYAHLTGLFLASCSSAELASASSGKTNVKQFVTVQQQIYRKVIHIHPFDKKDILQYNRLQVWRTLQRWKYKETKIGRAHV